MHFKKLCIASLKQVKLKMLSSISMSNWQTSLRSAELLKVVILQFGQVMVVFAEDSISSNVQFQTRHDKLLLILTRMHFAFTTLSSKVGEDKLILSMSAISSIIVASLVLRYLLLSKMRTVRFWK